MVIGGGYIGMEIAACLAKNGIHPTVVFPEPTLLSRMFTPDMASFYESYFEDKKVTFMKSDTAVEFEGEGGKVRWTLHLSQKLRSLFRALLPLRLWPEGHRCLRLLAWFESSPSNTQLISSIVPLRCTLLLPFVHHQSYASAPLSFFL